MSALLNRREYGVLLQHDFLAFAHRAFLHLHPTQPFISNWHIEVFLAKLEQCRLGQARYVILNGPPRSLKSLLASVVFPAWVLGHDPSKQIICVSYGETLANKLARDCLSVVESAW